MVHLLKHLRAERRVIAKEITAANRKLYGMSNLIFKNQIIVTPSPEN